MINFIRISGKLLNMCKYFGSRHLLAEISKPALLSANPFIRTASYNVFKISDLLIPNNTSYIIVRHKSKKKRVVEDDSDDDIDEDEDEEKEDEFLDDKSVKEISSPSLRLDAVVKGAFGKSRKKIVEAFYNNRLLLNERKIMKKSINVNVGDKIDLIKSNSGEDSDPVKVDRIEVLSYKFNEEKEKFFIKLRIDTNQMIK